MAGGRPTKYKDEYNQVVLDMAAEGKSVVQISAKLQITRSTFYEWVNTIPEFSNTFEICKELVENHWEDIIQKELEGRSEKPLNSALFKFYAAVRLGWKENKDENQVEAKPLIINFDVAEPKNEIKITEGTRE